MSSASFPWLILILPAVGLILLILYRSKRKSPVANPLPPFGRVRFDEEAIIHHRENDEESRLIWQDLTKLRILTTPEGPFLPDVFWVFESNQETILKIPDEAEGMSDLSNHLMKLKGFQSAEMIEAMSSTEYASFEVWQKPTAPSTF